MAGREEDGFRSTRKETSTRAPAEHREGSGTKTPFERVVS
jgi:hypothetical protein